jgi:acyl-CoA thioester hydrolase
VTSPAAPHLHRLTVRYSDLDTVKHVNNARFVSYIEDARVAFFRATGVPMRFEHNWGRVLARTEIDYLAPIFLEPEPVEIATWVEKIGNRSFTLRHTVSHHDTVRAQARVVIVAFDHTLKATRPLSDEERGALEATLAH